MAEPLVEVAVRSDRSDTGQRARVLSNVVAIATRPQYAAADAQMLRRVVAAPTPGRPIDWGDPVRRTKPAGRHNTVESRFLTKATRELFDRLGKTERRVVRGSVVLRWDLGEGTGMIVARKSSDDSKSGETIGGQLDAAISYCDHAGHKPRIVVAVLNTSGRAHFESRQDFAEVFEAFRRGESEWVCYRGMDRLARSVTWTALFVHYLREYGIGLHIAQLNRQVDLDNHFDMAQLWVMAMAAELDWANSFDRLQGALSRQMRDAGRGWSNTGGFGFKRDENGFVVVNEEVWPFVLLIHELYASLGTEVQVQQALRESHGPIGASDDPGNFAMNTSRTPARLPPRRSCAHARPTRQADTVRHVDAPHPSMR